MKRLNSTRRLTTQLALVFTVLSLVVALLIYGFTRVAILGTEDRLSLRHLESNQTRAEALYMTGAHGALSLDTLTMAYNQVDDVPAFVPRDLLGDNLGSHEVETKQGEYLLLNTHYFMGTERPLYLLYYIEPLELTEEEGAWLALAIIGITLLLLAILGTVLVRLSARLIQPVNDLSQQLAAHQGDPTRPFSIHPEAAQEFQELAAKMNHYRSEAHRLLQRERAFARYTSHELRTPITVIRGAARLLENGGQESFQARQRQRITAASGQMEETVDALLSLVKYERDEHRAERQLTGDEIRNIVERNRGFARDKAIEFNIQIYNEARVQASEAVMSMILGNLVRNAIAATAAGTIMVELDTNAINVSDPGVGLQGSSESGHGLGLLIVEDLCNRYGWGFRLENRKEGGCRASIDLKTP